MTNYVVIAQWQVPISGVRRGNMTAHLFPVSEATNSLVMALCGKEVNPGFATPEGKRTRRCEDCRRGTRNRNLLCIALK